MCLKNILIRNSWFFYESQSGGMENFIWELGGTQIFFNHLVYAVEKRLGTPDLILKLISQKTFY
jgi:hypothetical protein